MKERIRYFQNASVTDLRKFAVLMNVFISGIFGILLPLIFSESIIIAPFIVGWVFTAFAFVDPNLLKIVYIPWMIFSEILGAVNSRIILSLVFVLVIIPTALIFKIMKKDPMKRSFETSLKSYRIKGEELPSSSMENIF